MQAFLLLRRLEKQGLLSSEWDVDQTRPRRYYVLNDVGIETLAKLSGEWRQMTIAIDEMIRET